MSKVIFKFDKEKDLFNIWETCNKEIRLYDFKKRLTPNIIKICEGKEFEESKDNLEKIIKKVYESGLIEIFIYAVQKSWNKINDEFFKRLEKLMKKPIDKKFFTGYITTIGRCPYDYGNNYFMVSLFFSLPQALETTAHEIMHIHFHEYYWKNVEKKIGKEKTGDLKEALTVLLNLEFYDLWFSVDKGYEKHQELRKFIEEEWKKEKDFDILLEKCINYLKVNQ
ncbi:MAG: hypothetical protein WC584_04540 [Candidatus Pacearchaeota archaeon]